MRLRRAKKRRRNRSEPSNAIAKTPKVLTRRVNVVYGMVFLALTSLIVRLGYVQIAQGSRLRTAANNSMLVQVPVPPARGLIYDANGNLLAYDKPSYSIYLTRLPHMAENYKTLTDKLGAVFHVSSQSLMKTIQSSQGVQIRLFSNASFHQLSYLQEHRSEFPGVNVVLESQRVYPYGDLGGQVLGYVGKITADNYSYYQKLHYLPFQIVGRTGIEQQYENVLQGQVGYQSVQINDQGIPTKIIGFYPAPVPGQNIQLTLDGHLQALSQEIVMKAVTQSPYSADIHDAEAVMLDVKTGGVLAMVSYPYYDPNWFTSPGALSQHAHYLATSGAQMNHVIQSPRYPGSTVKPANLLAALNAGVVTPYTTIVDHYTTMIGTTPIHDDGGHGWVDPVKAIAVSCDTFFYELGLHFGGWFGSDSSNGGNQRAGLPYYTWLRTGFIKGINALFQGEWDFGLGQLTGIDLPNEQAGMFFIKNYTKGWAQVPYNLQAAEKSMKQTGSYMNYGTPADLADGGIGQSQEFTPIELAQYVMTLARNGTKLQPHVLKSTLAPNTAPGTQGKPVQEVNPVVQGHVQAKNLAYWNLIHRGMHGVVYTQGGTAYGVFANAPYQVAAKTGTAQIFSNGKAVDNSVFICYAPYNHPEVALAVMVPGGGYGAETSGTVARQMLDAYFQEHHEFFPKSQWQTTDIPANWSQSSAYLVPEQTP